MESSLCAWLLGGGWIACEQLGCAGSRRPHAGDVQEAAARCASQESSFGCVLTVLRSVPGPVIAHSTTSPGVPLCRMMPAEMVLMSYGMST
jgi:hypothetical protein